jgi:hypothetical protein
MALPMFLQPYLASYELSKLNKDDSSVAREVITQVLNTGDDEAVAWIFENYTLDKIREVIGNPQRGVWFEESLNYWSKILKVDIEDGLFQAAIFNLNPFGKNYV